MIQIDIPLPKSCSWCPLKTIEEDINGDYFYWCPIIEKAIVGKKYYERRFRDCPLKEVENNKEV